MKMRPMILRLRSGSETPLSALRKRGPALTVSSLSLRWRPKTSSHLFALAFAEQAVVDEDALELVADGLVQQRRRHRRIDAAAEAEQHAVLADLRAHRFAGRLDEALHRPARFRAADAEHEVGEDLRCRAACARPRDETAGRRACASSPRSPRRASCPRWRWRENPWAASSGCRRGCSRFRVFASRPLKSGDGLRHVEMAAAIFAARARARLRRRATCRKAACRSRRRGSGCRNRKCACRAAARPWRRRWPGRRRK